MEGNDPSIIQELTPFHRANINLSWYANGALISGATGTKLRSTGQPNIYEKLTLNTY